MLIINADDFGRTVAATDKTIQCHKEGVISSASIMVFMADSHRAAEAAVAAGIEVGLHLNLDLPFDGGQIPPQLKERQSRLVHFFSLGKWTQFAYNPLLWKDFDYVVHAQYEEFRTLFMRSPAHINGHHHRHLCMNMLVDQIVPPGLGLHGN